MDKEQEGNEQDYEKDFAEVIDHAIGFILFKKIKA
jgi:hypothetical protein